MNTLSLSVSNPRSENGSSLRTSSRTSVNSRCSRTSKGAHSVQPVAMSVKVNVCTKRPLAVGPPCATRSASTNPGAGSSQPSNVRTGTLLRTTAEEGARRPVLFPACPFTFCKARSIVAALIASRPVRTWGASCTWPCRCIASTRVGISGRSRLPQIRSDASQTTIRVSRTASS